MNDKKFRPVMGYDENIKDVAKNPIKNGYVYFATDTGIIYLDANGKRTVMSSSDGASSGIFYANRKIEKEEEDLKYIDFNIGSDGIEGDIRPQIDDLVLNTGADADGCFYRVTEILGPTSIKALRLSVVGGGGGGEGYAQAITVNYAPLPSSDTVCIYGQEKYITVTPMSAMDKDNNPADTYLTLTWRVRSCNNTNLYTEYKVDVEHNVPITLEFGSKLYSDQYNDIEFFLEGANSGAMKKAKVQRVNCVKLALKQHAEYTSLNIYKNATVTLGCVVEGAIKKILEYWFDDELVRTEYLLETDQGSRVYSLTNVAHGAHKVKIRLYQQLPDGNKGTEVPSLDFEIARVVAGETDPIIWLGAYDSVYNNYDRIQIPYLVYNPVSAKSTVRFYKSGVELSNSPAVIEYTSDISSFEYLEITDATIPTEEGLYAANDYQIVSEGVSREIAFQVYQTGKMILANQATLRLNFSAAGRSNKESTVTRSVWTCDSAYEVEQDPGTGELVPVKYHGEFENFNWYNNGWITDNSGNTCLRISNGAKFKIPLGATTFNSSAEGNQSQTFEFQFKIRNVQNYEHLIKLVTRYVGDEAWYQLFITEYKDQYDNYDQFLQYYLPTIGKSYDDLVYEKVQSDITTATALCNYFDNSSKVGFCLGTQDAFFKTNESTLNVNYVEDRIVNLALVFSKTEKLVSIYLNGVLSGSAYVTDTSAFTVNGPYIIFNSDYCDVDLYKFRVYANGFSIANVLNNYSVDLRDTTMYAQSTALSKLNGDIGEYQLDFNSVLTYNIEHPDEYLMPYIVFTTHGSATGDADALPYSKADKKKIDFQFVNTGLERAFETGELATLAQGYPSIEKSTCWIRQMDVESIINDKTSSAKYYFTNGGSKVYFDKLTLIDGGKYSSKSKKTTVYKEGSTTEKDEEQCYEVEVLRSISGVENYYLHHGASFSALKAELKTQGTSSQFYPRRNYKAKCKGLMVADKGPFVDDPLQMNWFYMDNDYLGTNKFTLKIDYMESSGSYNTGAANLVANAYTKHPLNDYEDAIDNLPALTGHRTSVQGFPSMAFHKKSDGSITYIGRYNINIDKGSDECYGYKLFKDNDVDNGSKLTTKFVLDKKGKAKKIADAAECWEFSDNNRGWCSFRDPYNRKELSFAAPSSGSTADEKAGYGTNANGSCPKVADSFEYRYNSDGDLLDYLYNPSDPGITEDDKDTLREDYANWTPDDQPEKTGEDKAPIEDLTWRSDFLLNRMRHWEEACKWVWSTCVDNVDSEEDMFVVYANKHTPKWTYNYETKVFSLTDNAYIDSLMFNKAEQTFELEEVKSALTEMGYTEAKLKELFGTQSGEEKVLTTDNYFQAYAGATGYKYLSYTIVTEDEVAKSVGTFEAGDVYSRAVIVSDINAHASEYATERMPALDTPYVFGNNTYYFDTKEYRLAKFQKEFSDHFDKEYTLVYFIVTELLMAYDSRGKNCMMASWGPQKEGGNYIWYPVFYDLDTQLGINNTGIPSFEYSVNATEDGCFSTNDSVLWGNIYRCFLDDIKATYQSLRTSVKNVNDPTGANRAPFAGIEYSGQDPVEHIENWYNANPKTCNSICMRGARPLIAINFDEYYKYISIMNPNGPGYQGTDGNPKYDESGAFLYALQGDRSLSRQQFLTRRINFVDSWLTQGNYKEGTGTTIKFRTSANDPTSTSDTWIDSPNVINASGQVVPGLIPNAGYYKDPVEYDEHGDPVKLHDLDADFFVKLTPFQKSYVTLATDNAPLPSIEYKGTAVRMEFPSNVITGVRKSPQYAEQLLYLYGANYLKDIGDVSLLYPREFELKGATHLQKIILGNDTPGYFNKKLKSPMFDAGGEGKPLLKEVVFTNVQTDDSTNQTFDFQSSEKLQIFRALGMNLAGVKFADGVALHTLHLPSTITQLVLKEARGLTGLISSYENPTRGQDGSWQAQKGLYIKDLTDKEKGDSALKSEIARFQIAGGNMGYDSFDILDKLYYIKENEAVHSNLAISLTDINWSPYTKLDKGYVYNPEEADHYYIDNGHYQLVAYTYDATKWTQQVLNGEIYIKNDALMTRAAKLNTIEMLQTIAADPHYTNCDDIGNEIPEITGNIYIDNDSEIEEGYLRNVFLTDLYPNLNIFVKTIKKAYSAKFVKVEDDGSLTTVDVQKVSQADAATKTWFDNPYVKYADMTQKDHYDFYGWSTVSGSKEDVIPEDEWDSHTYQTGVFEYTFYIIYEKHKYQITFKNDDFESEIGTLDITYGEYLSAPSIMPMSTREDSLPMEETYSFIGYTKEKGSSIPMDLGSIKSTQNMTFYALYEIKDVHDAITDSQYFSINRTTGELTPAAGKILQGKITIPRIVDGVVVRSLNKFGDNNRQQTPQPIKAVFFEAGSEVTLFSAYCFERCENLKWIEPISTLNELGQNSLYGCTSLLTTDWSACKDLTFIRSYACANAFSSERGALSFYFPSSVQILGDYAFGFFPETTAVDLIQFGTSAEASRLLSVGNAVFYQNDYAAADMTVRVYCSPADKAMLQQRVSAACNQRISVDIDDGH